MATTPTTDISNLPGFSGTAGDTSDAWAQWRTRIEAARRRRDQLVPEWQENVERRRGAPDETSQWAESQKVIVNQDWSLTKAKIAQLYSQTPEVRLTPRGERYQAALPIFARQVNDTITDICLL